MEKGLVVGLSALIILGLVTALIFTQEGSLYGEPRGSIISIGDDEVLFNKDQVSQIDFPVELTMVVGGDDVCYNGLFAWYVEKDNVVYYQGKEYFETVKHASDLKYKPKVFDLKDISLQTRNLPTGIYDLRFKVLLGPIDDTPYNGPCGTWDFLNDGIYNTDLEYSFEQQPVSWIETLDESELVEPLIQGKKTFILEEEDVVEQITQDDSPSQECGFFCRWKYFFINLFK
jgi:hypothetical protein